MNDPEQREPLVELQREVATVAAIVQQIADRLGTVEEKVDDLTRYKGAVGRAMWIGGLAWAAVTVFRDQWQ